MSFTVVIAGGTGQVGSATVKALLAYKECKEVVAIVRKSGALPADPRLREVVMDTAAGSFEADVTKLVQAIEGPVYGVSCIGIGAGSSKWSEEDMVKLEVGVVGAFARGCLAAGVKRFGLLSAVGSTEKSSIRYIRVMGKKENAVKALGFPQLAIFQPGIIGGNKHTPGIVDVLGRLVPGRFGTIHQDDIGKAIISELATDRPGLALLENGAMKKRSAQL